MTKPHRKSPVISNRLLASLPEPERARLASRLVRVPLKLKHVLYRQGEPISQVCFPDSGVVSLVSIMDDGKSVGIGVIGNEGVVGIHAMYSMTMPCEALVQTAGEAWLLRAEDLRREIRAAGRLAELLGRYSQAFLTQTVQTAACNRLHSIRQRAARWILMMQDRAQVDRLPLTQELLAVMLGARRPSVTVVARSLQRSGLIRYRHGTMEIRDRPKLETASCECYRFIREHSDFPLPLEQQKQRDTGNAVLHTLAGLTNLIYAA